MLTIEINQTGGPEVIQAVDRPDPVAGPGEVVVRNRAVSVNFIDTYHRKGLYPLPLPTGLGSEGVGEIVAVGDDVHDLVAGDRVAYFTATRGAYAELTAIPADRAVRLPPEVDFNVAAASFMKALTVQALLTQTYAVQPGDPILIHAAAGGVGTIMTQWAKALGALVIGTVGSEAKAELARENGCDHVILYDREDVPARVMDITGGQGVRAVYDSVGAATFEGSLQSLGRRGWMVTFGNASGPPPPIDPLRLMRGGSLVLTRPTVADFIATREELLRAAAGVFDKLASGAIRIRIGQRFALKDAAEAHRALESRATVGATVLIP
jgi:NADPH2:quinone reductase